MANCKAREIPGCRQMLLCSKEILTKCCEGGTRQIRLIQLSLKLKACGSSRLLICPWPKLAFAELIIVGGQSKYMIIVGLSKVGQTMSLVSTLLPYCKIGKCNVK